MQKSEIQEQLATLYLRLNGYFVSGFIAHAPSGSRQTNRTQVDALAVRFPKNCEPERGVPHAEYLQTPKDKTDVLVCEVKGGSEPLQFNIALRQDPVALKSVLRWIGAFEEGEIEILVPQLRHALTPSAKMTPENFGTVVGPRDFQIRCVLFAPDRVAPRPTQARYVCGKELIAFIWRCLREGAPRPECATRYDFGLWGPYKDLIRVFKEGDTKPSMEDIYSKLIHQEPEHV